MNPLTAACQDPLSMRILQIRILEWVATASSRGSSQSRDWTQVCHTAGRFFTDWATKPKNTGVGNLFLLQGIFPTQEPNCGLLQSCLTLCNRRDGSLPGSSSLGFSRQEHWSGLPFPSPMHESEKWKWSHSVVSHSSRSHGLQPTRLLRPWDFPSKSTGVGCHCLLHPTTQMDSLPAKLPEMPHGKMVLDLTFWFDPEGHEMVNLKIQTFCYQLMG